MGKQLDLSVYEIVGNPLCVASSDGEKVHDRLVTALQEWQSVMLSFKNISTLTSAFLNAAIGQLYGTFSEEEIRSLLNVRDMQPDDLELLKRVVETAKQYFKDPDKFDRAVRETLGNGGDDV